MNATTEKPAARVGMWAIVELFGHQRIAGFMTEHVIAGQSFVRIDVPEVAAPDPQSYAAREGAVIHEHSKMFGAGAIYAINPVDEAIALAAAAQIRHAPVMAYGLRDALANLPEEHRRRLLAVPGTERAEDDIDS